MALHIELVGELIKSQLLHWENLGNQGNIPSNRAGEVQVGYLGIFPHGKGDQVLEGDAQGRVEPAFLGIIPKTPGSGTWGTGFGGIGLNLRVVFQPG